jgi:hypothetical protein
MSRRGSYYLSRVIKAGQLNQETLIQAIARPATILVGKYAWTITDAMKYEIDGETVYVYGKLSKYSPKGTVKVVKQNSEMPVIEPNLIEASSPFIYIPEFSGIAYLHVWNQIERDVFASRFSRIIEESFGGFFVECKIEPITNLEKFLEKLRTIENFMEISAKVNPPNPLFGEAWRSLREYLAKRQIGELRVKERAGDNGSILSDLPNHINGILSQGGNNPYKPEKPIDITDAGILMAADGYGDGKIVGSEKATGRMVILRVSEKHTNFLFEIEPEPEALFREAHHQFKNISNERNMDHA